MTVWRPRGGGTRRCLQSNNWGGTVALHAGGHTGGHAGIHAEDMAASTVGIGCQTPGHTHTHMHLQGCTHRHPQSSGSHTPTHATAHAEHDNMCTRVYTHRYAHVHSETTGTHMCAPSTKHSQSAHVCIHTREQVHTHVCTCFRAQHTGQVVAGRAPPWGRRPFSPLAEPLLLKPRPPQNPSGPPDPQGRAGGVSESQVPRKEDSSPVVPQAGTSAGFTELNEALQDLTVLQPWLLARSSLGETDLHPLPSASLLRSPPDEFLELERSQEYSVLLAVTISD